MKAKIQVYSVCPECEFSGLVLDSEKDKDIREAFSVTCTACDTPLEIPRVAILHGKPTTMEEPG